MGQRDRRYGRMADDRSGRYENRSSYGGSYGSSEEGWGDRGSHERSSFEQGRSNRESSTGSGYGRRGRGGESMRGDIEDRWQGRESGSSARDYDYGYGRSGISARDYENEGGYREGGYYGGGGLYRGGMGGYTGGGYRGGGLGSNFDTSSPDYRDYPRSEEGYRGRGREGEGWWDRMTNEVSSWFTGDEYDDRSGESYRGRGPRGYTRSDDRIKEDINDRLTDHYAIDASDLDVEVNGREVILTGTVNSRHQKRLAEDIAESVSGVSNVENRLRVKRTDSWFADSDTTTGTSSTSDTSASTQRGRSASGT